MSALLTPRRPSRPRRAPRPEGSRQEPLFGALPAAPLAPAPAARPAPDAPAAPARPEAAAPATVEPGAVGATEHTASAHRQGPTLDDLVAGAWEGLLVGAPAACPVCETTLTPRFAAGPGVVGGRCGGCGSTLG